MNEFRVILAEDDDDDYLMTEEAVEAMDYPIKLERVRDGKFLMDRLHEMMASGEPLPHLILLDLNMPRMGGNEVMRLLLQDASLKSLPVVVLTTSSQPEDVESSFNEGANSFITKPVNFREFQRIVQETVLYWAEISRVPRRSHA